MRIEFRKRRRVSRLLAARHLLRHGSLSYGVGFQGPVRMIGPNAPYHLLVTNCHFDWRDPSAESSHGTGRGTGSHVGS